MGTQSCAWAMRAGEQGKFEAARHNAEDGVIPAVASDNSAGDFQIAVKAVGHSP